MEMSGVRRVAVVTGASRGIGAAIARRLAADGFLVAGISQVNRSEPPIDSFLADVSSEHAVREVAAGILGRFGRVDVLVNSAGIAGHGDLAGTSYDKWNRTLSVNVGGAFLVMREFLPLMAAAGWGRVINIASVSAKRGEPQMVAYATSKHALIGLTRAGALHAARSGVTVNAICPGPVETALLDEGLKEWSSASGRSVEVAKRVWQSASPQNRFLDADEVAAMVSYLVSSAAGGVNGQAMNICGGAYAF